MISSDEPVAEGLIFLGGTCGNNPWRQGFVDRLVRRGVPRDSFFDPVVDDWNEGSQAREAAVKRDAALLFFYLGDPRKPEYPLSAYALVEATLAVCRDPDRTVVVFDVSELSGHPRRAMEQAERLLHTADPRAHLFSNLAEAEDWIVSHFDPLRAR